MIPMVIFTEIDSKKNSILTKSWTLIKDSFIVKYFQKQWMIKFVYFLVGKKNNVDTS